ncbi:hypothetical protein Tco_0084217 [Tanacetum coccineum]
MKLPQAPILVAPDWTFPLKSSCDAVNFAVGAVPRQRTTMHSSDTLCQANYGSRLNTLHNQRKKNYMTMILSKIALALPLPLLSSNELNLQSCLLLCYISSVAPVDFAGSQEFDVVYHVIKRSRKSRRRPPF